MRLVGISGSLRAGSFNTALLQASQQMLVDEGVALEIADIGELPLYNQDLGEVAAVVRLNDLVREADGAVIATPEYNYGIPGPLKNAIDWCSRPSYDSPFRGKPVGLMGATGSLVGTARAQAHLKTVLLGMLAHPFPSREVLVSRASQRFEDGLLVDAPTEHALRTYLVGYLDFVRRLTQ